MPVQVAAVAVAVLWVTACSANRFDSRVGEQLAADIRAANSPIVRDVVYRSATMIDPPEVDVWLRPGATEEQAVSLWCEVIAPAGGSAFEGERGVVVWDDAGTEMMAVNPDCSN